MKILGCLFDMDGVIVDTAKHHYIAWKSLADELAIPFTEVDNNALKGRSRLDRLECILRSCSNYSRGAFFSTRDS